MRSNSQKAVSFSPVKDVGAVRRAPFALLVFFVASIFAKSTAPEVTFVSPCECIGFQVAHARANRSECSAAFKLARVLVHFNH
jgi:hypothetical protein